MSSVWWDRIGADAAVEHTELRDSDSTVNRAVFAVVLGGLIAGTCDPIYAVAFYSAQGVPPIRIPQSIACGILGTASYQHGWASASLGIGLHFLIAFCAAAIYYLASRRIHILLSRAPFCGALYGAAIYFFMRKVVVPLSAAPLFKSTALSDWTDFGVHVFLIGLPIALTVRRYTSPSAGQPSSADRAHCP